MTIKIQILHPIRNSKSLKESERDGNSFIPKYLILGVEQQFLYSFGGRGASSRSFAAFDCLMDSVLMMFGFCKVEPDVCELFWKS